MERQVLIIVKSIVDKSLIGTYFFFFLNSCLQILFPPYPGDTITIFQGYLTYRMGFNKYLMLLSTISGSFLSSMFLYYLSYAKSDIVLNNRFIIKFFNLDKINKLEDLFKKYGVFFILINKFIPGLGSLTFIAAGIFKLPLIPATISILLANVLHNTMLFSAGALTGDNMEIIKASIKEYYRLIVGITVIISLLYLIIRSRIKLYRRSVK
ncbi:DedA family protein [Caloramator proteoclasticus]|uniref:Membrane protein DedA, SNARE-associated domain n=1 Tax=Caloramator proteoclasticus DSM 10124 TaxID=1121262 RepID=A0A1M4WAU6_9CLOT|nr:DedA family protein [Caloramator proteoclasticus]SHE78280.1 membrane protein DedA, SNARE-associated domain [Caloramator proteoclasticus DSM 10124]